MICGCVLPYYDKDVCKKCLANVRAAGDEQFPVSADNRWQKPIDPYKWIMVKTQKVTERFDMNGNLIERIVEEV